MQFFVMTDKGRVRAMNEDFIFASDKPEGNLPNLFMVADGMGGHKAGEYASRLAITSMLESIRDSKEISQETIINNAIKTANEAVYICAKSEEDKAGMGTTLVAVVVDEKILIANVGDSRAYYLKDGRLEQITRDHTMVEEMLRIGSISKTQAKYHPNRHVITRAIGAERDIRPDFFSIDRNGVEQILLCSDGLTNMVGNEKIESILMSDDEVSHKGALLMEEANANGGVDNITLIIIDLMR